MKILILTQWFEPEFTLKGMLLARELKRHGHEVEILTGFPNYPGGVLYDGYRIKPFQREVIDGISIIRVALYPSHDRSAFRRSLNYISFTLSAAIFGAFLIKRADIMYVYHPPGTIGFAAWTLSTLKGIPFIYDIQDFWPETLRSTGMVNNHTILSIIDRFCRLSYRLARHIVVLSPGFKDLLLQRGVDESKISVIYNWADERYLYPKEPVISKDEMSILDGKFNIIFAGNLGRAQALHYVLDAAERMQACFRDVQFVFVGTGLEEQSLKDRARTSGLANVHFLPRRPISQVTDILAAADVLLIHIKDDPLFEITVPSKTQAYMSVGKPILMACRGDARDLVERAACGLCCDPGNIDQLVGCIQALYGMSKRERAQLGLNGRRFYEQELCLAVGVKKTIDVLQGD